MFGNHRLQRIRGRHQIVVAYLALFVALGGSAVAAKPLLDGSDVQDESLTSADIQNDSLTGDDILESSLGKVGDADTLDGKNSTDFLGSSAKAADADKLDGSDSTDFLRATGTAADADKLDGKDSTQFLEGTQRVTGPEVVIPAKEDGPILASAFAVATCPSGTHVTGGGYLLNLGYPSHFHPAWSYPTHDGWRVLAYSSWGHEMKYTAYALCAS